MIDEVVNKEYAFPPIAAHNMYPVYQSWSRLFFPVCLCKHRALPTQCIVFATFEY